MNFSINAPHGREADAARELVTRVPWAYRERLRSFAAVLLAELEREDDRIVVVSSIQRGH